MKWSVIGLVSLGGLAGISAAVLVASLPRTSQPRPVSAPELEVEQPPFEEPAIEEPKLDVLIASRDLAAMAVVEASQVERRHVLASQAPAGSYSDPVQVVGKLLITPMTTGQPFTPDSFASEQSGLHISTALHRGKRAVNVTLSDTMGMEELLYPGSVVDVLASMKFELEDGVGQHRVSMTILQNVFVLAVGGQTVVGDEEEEGLSDARPDRRPTVTLLVDPEEAEILKLAMDEGSVSLAMRNPMDDGWTNSRGTRAGSLSPLIALLEESKRNNLLEKERHEMEMERSSIANEPEARPTKEEKTAPAWVTLVLRGGVPELKTFEDQD
jgi:pilus assembly protein CpaB